MTRQTQRRRRRRSSVCHRHPTSKPTVGPCATCLRERLSTIQALSSDQVPELRRVRDAEEDEEGRASRRLLEEETEDDGVGEKKTMKELIDLESRTTTHQTKKNDVASVLTRTLKKLSLKLPKNGNNQERRSCDVDPSRLSLDLGGISLEEPRASWDGCLTEKTDPKLVPLSAVAEEEKDPGGTSQTRDYYFDSRRRRSFDRSTRHGSLEVDELKAKLSSPEGVGLFYGATKLLVTERELRDSDWYSIKPERLELASKDVGCVAAGEVKKTGKKWPKGCNLWGLIQRKADDTGKKEIKTDVMEGPFVETLLKLRRVAKGESSVSEKLMRSYSVSARKSCDGMFHGGSVVNGFEGGRRSSCDGLFHGSVTGVETGRRRRRYSCDDRFFHGIEDKQNHLLQRGAKLESYSPDNLRNNMVRFYLTPLKSQTTSNSGKSRLIH
ncbi:hypothetical protein HA466_0045600 [Hirschfeldia incana]|nr:hypothetical protein HA466_0045600 [Hirschfeldia incana]